MMLSEVWQEITELTKNQQFVRNLGFVIMLTLASSCCLATEYTNPARAAQQAKIEQFSSLMSVGLCVKTQTILTK
jgi:hypothetical protein